MSSVTTDDGRNTPTSSTVFDDPRGLEDYERPGLTNLGEPPSEGRTYIIRDSEAGLVLAVEEGVLNLLSQYTEDDGRIHWRCIRHHDGWYGFRNMGSGTLIGHNRQGQFVAQATNHADWEQFRVEHDPDGGYTLLVKRTDWFRFWLEPMVIDSNGQLVLAGARERGTVWKFIRVDNPI
ncbi:uncharacterized protein TRUGW13939_06397 [Talaromyces rugulosus]|uniref:Ricin B lectin domain-containing protein n=1 Tax=Talaromyces rugulosus TaxID=121627 RepID=A0A7H8R0K3_TALRU|nr:uncharacterized protein TRUGW13939_06397 [Talaromyces rugulosus]QKX59265.1 hypothetical protein TRUGW13939_06397 [Talaromyces rugulosus]